MIWAWTACMAFTAISGIVMAMGHLFVAVHPLTTWPRMRKSAALAGLYGSAAVVAAISLVRVWI